MDKDAVKGWIGCLTPIIAIAIYVVSYRSCQESKVEKYYYVEQTGYFHSTKDEDSCRFVKQAKERDYDIKKVTWAEAVVRHYKMCKVCFSCKAQKDYHKKEFEHALLVKRTKDHDAWMSLDADSIYDYKNLFVYIDEKEILHIDGNCLFNKGMKRIAFNDVDTINDTCEDCVERWIIDFIYKAVYEKVYDKSVIKYQDNNWDEDYSYWPERDR